MKRAPLIFAAATPIVALAGGSDQVTKVDRDALRDDWRVSEIIGAQARGSDGQNVGEVKDVILTDDGDIASILVDTSNLQEDQGGFATRSASQKQDVDDAEEDIYTERGSGPATAGTEDVRSERGGPGLGESGEGVVAVQWQNPSFNAEENVVELSASSSELQRLAAAGTAVSATAVDMQRRDGQTDIYGSERGVAAGNARTGTTETDATGTGDVQAGTNETDTRTRSAEPGLTAGSETEEVADSNIRASELLGMDVHLSDEESYGEIEDVLISKDGKASAYIIDAGNFFQTEQYALPADASVDQQEQTVRYELTSEELESIEEFDLDENLQST